MIYELSDLDILRIINTNCVGSGVYGMVYEYDDSSLIKIYYKDFFPFFRSKDIDDLDRMIDINKFVEDEMLSIRDDYVTKLERLVNIFNMLKKADCSLMKGVALYRGYPIGVILNYYKDYSKLEDVFLDLDEQNKLVIMNKIKAILYKLLAGSVCPLDLKEGNILVNVKNLDVKFIDLDGEETKYENGDLFKQDVIESFNLMEQRLNLR